MTDNFLRSVNKIEKKTSNVVINVLFTIAILIVSIVVIQKLFFKNKIPQICGYKVLQVISGSMAGEIEVGETILIKDVKNENELNVGDIVTYKEGTSTLITHRIVEISGENGKSEYVLKGDANNANDSKAITFDEIEGKYVTKITWMGKIIDFINTPIGMTIICAIPLVIIIIFTLKDRKKDMKKTMRMEKRLKYELEVTMKNEK